MGEADTNDSCIAASRAKQSSRGLGAAASGSGGRSAGAMVSDAFLSGAPSSGAVLRSEARQTGHAAP